MLARLKGWARTVKRDVIALFLAARDSRTPWYAKAMAGLIAAYALSPIDLIPDFIPVIGHLDDLVIVPLGIWIVVKLVPPDLMQEFRAEAERMSARPVSRAGALIIAALWIVAAGLLLWCLWPRSAA
jgi:uncharacterized membrane protein YkvA (DUF1232 family)